MRPVVDLLDRHPWPSLVTAALLGTDRRPLETGARALVPPASGPRRPVDPVRVLLDLAAAHRSVRQAGSPLPYGPALDAAPAGSLPMPPAAAQELLGALLVRPEPALVNAWLGRCTAAGLGAPAEHWPRLAELAARSRDYDRGLLRQALGPRGLWFLTRHPRWRPLAEDPGRRSDDSGDDGTPGEEALGLLVRGRLDARTLELAERAAATIPLAAGRALLERLEGAEDVPTAGLPDHAPPAARRAVERARSLIRQTLARRLEIEESFGHLAAQGPDAVPAPAEAAP